MTHALQQSALFNAALSRLGRPPRALSLPSGDAFALSRYGLLLTTRAQLSPSDLARAGVHLVNAEDSTGFRTAGYRQIMTPAHICALDLTLPLPALAAAQHPKWRARLARAEAELPKGTKITHRAFSPLRDMWLLEAEAEQSQRRRYRSYPPALTLAMSEEQPRALRLFTLTQKGAPVAAMLFVCHAKSATYHIGWSGPQGRACAAHWLLLWRAIRDLKARGQTGLELGTVDTESGKGLARFKLGSGARLRALGGTWARLAPLQLRKT